MAKKQKSKTIIFTSKDCGPCDLFEQIFKNHPDYKLMDIDSEEADQYLKNLDEVPVPLARKPDGTYCYFEGGKNGISMRCGKEGETEQICDLKQKEDGTNIVDCGNGEINVDED